MSIVSPHAAYRRTLEDYPDIEELLERSRERRRANDAAAVEDAQEVMEQFTTPRPSPPAVVHPATRPDEGTNSWGRAIGEALGRVGGAVVNKIVNKPEPEAPAVEPPLPTPTFTPPSPPAEPGTLPSLRPVDSSDQLADAHEQPQGRDGLRPATSPLWPRRPPTLVVGGWRSCSTRRVCSDPHPSPKGCP
jgi:hypothetical protein